MKIIFGKESCSLCQKVKNNLNEKGEYFIYHDLNTVNGLSEAAARGIINLCKQGLPVVLEE